MENKKAYSINEIAKIGSEGRTRIYKAISEGRLVARKSGRRTIILADDYERYLRDLPLVGLPAHTSKAS